MRIRAKANEANSRRKKDHLDIALNNNLDYDSIATGLDDYRFVHQALPEVDLATIDLSTSLCGKVLRAPLLVSPMIGGIEESSRINRNLARAAQNLGVAMGVGSQRRAIEDPQVAHTYEVRDIAPDILLFANLGAIQLNYGYGLEECRRAVDMIGADGLILHLNPLQEALQEEGETNFAGILERISSICHGIGVPVIVKEVGYGISEDAARQLTEAGVAGIDVAGAGGTTWSEMEKHRANSHKAEGIASAFGSWGIPTAESIQMSRRGSASQLLVASGGIRNGVDAAKAIALGADVAGMAMPLLKAANNSAEEATALLEHVIEELRICMFCIGASDISTLKDSPFLKRRPGHAGSMMTAGPSADTGETSALETLI